MMVHRLLERYLAGGRSVAIDKLEEQCNHSSSMEQLAANAERASIKYKQVEYMADRIGETYEGMISGVTEWGLYVELTDNKCEGLVPMRDLADDYYDFDEKNYCLRGRRRGNVYRLGDMIHIRVANANLDRKQLDFIIVDAKGNNIANATGTDDMGNVVSVAQALSTSKGSKAKKSGHTTRHDKAKATAKKSRSAHSGDKTSKSKRGKQSVGYKAPHKRRAKG
jgi:ribonuclease R